MKKMFRLLILFVVLLAGEVRAQVNSPCTPAIAQVDLDVNNVRARIMAGGDLWWDLNSAHYEIPAGSGKSSIFCGSFWLGALDASNNLFVCGNHYYDETDFYPGPLDTLGGYTYDSTCSWFDRLWKINRMDVESFIANRHDPNFVVPEAIRSWPGNGNPVSGGYSHSLAPYVDVNGDGVYNYLHGDYPSFNFSGQNDCNNDLLGDQMIWWVFNDNGAHNTTYGAPMHIEIQSMAYAFRSQEEHLNNATFYRYKIVNRSTSSYHDMYFSNWWDPDIGDSFDDTPGCDVGRGLAYCYNGDLYDGAGPVPAPGMYGDHPPAIGLDYLSGPLADESDMLDNDHDSLVDEPGERFVLSGSIYYIGAGGPTNYPAATDDYYDYLKVCWRDGAHLTYGSDGYGGSVVCDFMFPGDSDPYGWGTYGVPQSPWYAMPAVYGMVRGVNSMGPFTMDAGEVDVVHVAIPWARDMSGDNMDAIDRLKEADDYVQNLFDNCFALPCAAQPLPEISYTYQNKLAAFTLFGNSTAWNWNFGDGQTSSEHHPTHYYTVPGTYTITVEVTSACGVAYDTTTLHVADYLEAVGPEITRIEGQGNGNCVLDFTKETIDQLLASPDQRVLFPVYAPMHGPVKVSIEDYHHLEDGEYRIAFDGIYEYSNWKMWRIGGTDTVYSDTTIGSGLVQRIAMWGLGVQIQQVKYPGYGNNPDRNGYLTSSVSFADPSRNWLSGIPDGDLTTSENWIRSGDRRGTGTCIAEFNDRFNGINAIDPNEDFESMIGGTWAPYRIASFNPQNTVVNLCYKLGPAWTPNPLSATTANRFEYIANVDVVITSDKTKWTRCPVIETGQKTDLNEGDREQFHLRAALSVDKNGHNVNNGGLSDPQNPEAADYIGANGMGWFPGYAINLETGERLNMAFGENSAFVQENGRDMLWNPTENEYQSLEGNLWGGCHYIYVFGHNADAVYTTGALTGELKDIPMYDSGKAAYTILASDNTSNAELREVYSDAMWTTIPVLTPGHSFMESDVTVKLRVQKPYARYQTDSVPQNGNNPLYGFLIDKWNLTSNVYEGDVTVFPNPFTEQTVIHFANTHEHNANVKLYDVQGKLVREYNTRDDRVTIAAAGLNPGMYVYTLEVEGEKAKTGKLVLR